MDETFTHSIFTDHLFGSVHFETASRTTFSISTLHTFHWSRFWTAIRNRGFYKSCMEYPVNVAREKTYNRAVDSPVETKVGECP